MSDITDKSGLQRDIISSQMAMRPRAANSGRVAGQLNQRGVIQQMENTTPTGFVYVIHAIGTNRVKVGFSKEPEKRLKELQTGSPYKLSLLTQWPGNETDERRAHARLRRYKIGGEWFDIPPFHRARIKELILTAPNTAGGHMTARECILGALPMVKTGNWWELHAKTYGYAIKLRWREGKRKCVYGFKGLSYRHIEVLLDADLERRKKLLCGYLLTELYIAKKRDIAQRIIL